jgi:hypothetical protein
VNHVPQPWWSRLAGLYLYGCGCNNFPLNMLVSFVVKGTNGVN